VPGASSSFSVVITPDPAWVGVGFRRGSPDSKDLAPNSAIYDVNVKTLGPVTGSITRIVRTLRDRETNTILGIKSAAAGFTYGDKLSPCGIYDPLRQTGSQTVEYDDDLGFVGSSAILQTDVTIADVNGVTQTITSSASWQMLPPPIPQSPVNTVVRQNDPATGCAFDPVHGYGLALDLSWGPAPGAPSIDAFNVDVIDGAGTLLVQRGYVRGQMSARVVLCGVDVPPGAEHGRVAVNAFVGVTNAESAWSVETFDFQSCRDAGVPACR
jgi:hypothetical protein